MGIIKNGNRPSRGFLPSTTAAGWVTDQTHTHTTDKSQHGGQTRPDQTRPERPEWSEIQYYLVLVLRKSVRTSNRSASIHPSHPSIYPASFGWRASLPSGGDILPASPSPLLAKLQLQLRRGEARHPTAAIHSRPVVCFLSFFFSPSSLAVGRCRNFHLYLPYLT
jgi:hypothetical protein